MERFFHITGIFQRRGKESDDLVKYRLMTAADKLRSAQILLKEGQYKDFIGRSYYAIFSALRAVLALEEKDFTKHSGVIAYFQKEYVKTGRFDIKYSKYIQQAFQVRNSCDYDDFYIATKEDAEEQYIRAKELLEEVHKFLGT